MVHRVPDSGCREPFPIDSETNRPWGALVTGGAGFIGSDLVDDLVSRADVAFHLAAAVGVKLIVERPLEFLVNEEGDRVLGSPLVGRWSYSTSKAVDEIFSHAYWKAKGLPTVIVRLFNTVGPRQSGEYGMVIVPALIALMESTDAEGQAINVGSTEEVTILELAKLVGFEPRTSLREIIRIMIEDARHRHGT